MELNYSYKNIRNTNSSIILDINNDSKILIIVFGGIRGKLPFPVFEFFNTLNKYKINKMFVRDLNQAWYTKGLKGICNDAYGVKKYLDDKIKEINPTKTIFIGNSAGGYAAILFGVLCDINEIHAFSPQTFLDKTTRFFKRDSRWKKEIQNIDKSKTYNKSLNLKNFLKHYNLEQITINIYYSLTNKLDIIHTKMISNFSINFCSYQTGGHELIKELRDNGELYQIIEKSVSEKF